MLNLPPSAKIAEIPLLLLLLKLLIQVILLETLLLYWRFKAMQRLVSVATISRCCVSSTLKYEY